MKLRFCLGITLLLLAACSADEPAEPVAGDALPDAAQDAPAAEATSPDDAAEEADEAPQIVEESAAEPEPEDQPIVLAQSSAPVPARSWQFKENTHYHRLVPTQRTIGGADKIEVAEFFWYGCPHCYDFERYINPWAANLPANVRFVRVPAMWDRRLVLHAKLFYTEEALSRNGVIDDPAAFRDAVFSEYHRRGNRLATEESIRKLFARFGVSAEDFDRTWNSFEVDQKLRVAQDLAQRYNIANVPTMVVNGKYRTGGSEAGSYEKLLEILDELIARESVR